MLSLVLALALALPAAGLADDVAFHDGHHGRGGLERSASLEAAGGHQAADPGVACHVHCGCHVTVSPCDPGLVSPPMRGRPRFARTRDAARSIDPDTLSRPPRA